ncbi:MULTISPECIES: DUF397 domain-containing protein [Streptomyces]|uniref:DUF397 domain-containing protein n=1 Tax=Streptomyces murinus TaxID=33900 RepID=A0A7W3NR50_STRMR|nr:MULTISPECIES: DUF397 domain-containing protein [Streptomyces]MBA9055235.1 hypothetical protein [Streptomyces murinus]UWW89834.1 DUF397 domain-containing protein [Streptomyces murinus]
MSTESRAWFKSSYSSNDGGECVELSYSWRKSSYSGAEGGDCVEVAEHPTAIHIRDSKRPTAPHLTIHPTTWAAFIDAEKTETA